MFKLPYPEAALHRMFGRWAARELSIETWDAVKSFSGVSEEILRLAGTGAGMRIVVRASSHIRTQARLLDEEARRTGTQLDHPSAWMIAREEREYALAENILVLSKFSLESFCHEGVPRAKLRLMPLGADFHDFRPSQAVVEARCTRILSGDPLRVLFVGALSFQKGLRDFAAILKAPASRRFRFRLVGPLSIEAHRMVSELPHSAEFVGKRPQAELPEHYSWGDVFLFPTIQDGFPVVLAQAAAGALPILTTTNCSGPDLVHEGESGWVLPIRSPESFLERLAWCDTHREELAQMVRDIYCRFQPRTWAEVAVDFESICAERIAAHGYQQVS